jgi:hypothetical protein
MAAPSSMGAGDPGGRWGLPVLTWRLVVAAAVGSLVVLLLPVRPPLGLWVVNGVLVVAAVADWWLTVRPAEVEVERELPGIVPLGTEARVVWRISHGTADGGALCAPVRSWFGWRGPWGWSRGRGGGGCRGCCGCTRRSTRGTRPSCG